MNIRALALCLCVCAFANAVFAREQSVPPLYNYTAGKLYNGLMAPRRANELAAQLKDVSFDHSGDQRSYGQSAGYLLGIFDALNNKLFCAPRGYDVVQDASGYLSDHHEMWEQPAAYVIEKWLVQAFPCKNSSAAWASHRDFLLNYTLPPAY